MPDPARSPLVAARTVTRVTGAGVERVEDAVAVERPLEIRIDGRAVVVTLRSPGHDLELALGFLAGEGILRRRADVELALERPAACPTESDAIELTLARGVPLDWTRLERHFAATAACGLCGRAHLESLRAGLAPLPAGAPVPADLLASLPARVNGAQAAFRATGGLHAAALVADDGEVEVLREDVGRHNAVDKVCGWLVALDRYPATGGILWVSGRAGAEIVLKAARARIPVVAAVGAPSTLAIEIAEAAGTTLVGFLRDARMNVYGGWDRLAPHGGGAPIGRKP